MQKFWLIGESGGSKTDWALLKKNERATSFSSSSLHPANWSSFDFQELKNLFEENQIDFAQTEFLFYGAGCNNQEKQAELAQHLTAFPFATLKIKGDLTAAAIAALGTKDGHVSILGSGSVFIDYQNEEVVKYTGGFGREKGDEGGGYYFGKMVLEAFVNKKLQPIQESILKAVISVADANQLKKGNFSDQLCLNLPFFLSSNLFEFEAFHIKNMSLFFDEYVEVDQGSTLHFVGSYAYFHQEILKRIVQEKGYSTGEIIARPMDKMMPYFQNKLDTNEM